MENLAGAGVAFIPQEIARLEEALDAQTVHGRRERAKSEGKSFDTNWEKK